MPQRMKLRARVLVLSAALIGLGLGWPAGLERPAWALHFTDPPPTLEAALQQASGAGRPLVLVFSATWCGPCKRLARDLRKPQAQAARARVHLVTYDGESDLGQGLMARYRLSSFPSLVVLDRTGAEVERKPGYGSWDDMDRWLRGLPERALPLREALAAAESKKDDGPRLLELGRRLLRAGQVKDAQRLWARAEKAGPRKVAAEAAWQLALLSNADAGRASGAALATALAERYAGTSEGDEALRYLAALPTPPTPVLNRLLLARAADEKSPGALGRLAYVALKGRAYQAAHAVAQRLLQVAPDEPRALAARAEVLFLAEDRAAEAVPLMERAVAAARGAAAEEYRASLARYQRGQGEPPRELLSFDAPTLLPAPERGGGGASPMAQRLRRLEQALSRECWSSAPAQPTLNLVVIAGPAPQPPRLRFQPGTAPALAACADRIVQAAGFPAGEVRALQVDLASPQQAEALDEALGRAEDDCQPAAGETHSLEIVLSGAPGQALQVDYPDGARPELVRCVAAALSAVRLQVTLLEVQHLRFRGAASP